jgi:hypothetical protein
VITTQVSLHLTSHTCIIQTKWENMLFRYCKSSFCIHVFFLISQLSKRWLFAELFCCEHDIDGRFVGLLQLPSPAGSQFPSGYKRACKPHDIHFAKWICPSSGSIEIHVLQESWDQQIIANIKCQTSLHGMPSISLDKFIISMLGENCNMIS